MRRTLFPYSLIAIALAAFLVAACSHYQVHPGAVSQIDSAAYDALLLAEATIDEVKADVAAGKLPDTIKPVLNKAILSYDVARTAWLAYRNLQTDSSLQILNQDLGALDDAIFALRGVTK